MEKLDQQDKNLIEKIGNVIKSGMYCVGLGYKEKIDEKIESFLTDNTTIFYKNYYNLIKKNWNNSEIIPCFDKCIESLNIKQEIKKNNIIIPPKQTSQNLKPLKIAIFTHLNHAPESYSPARGIKNQIKMLQQFGHSVELFVLEGSELDYGCVMRTVVPKFKRIKWVIDQEAKNKFINILKQELPRFDLAITHDYYIDDCITYREAIKECGVDIQWLHWARSGIGQGFDFYMPNARYVYMNYADTDIFAKKINVPIDKVRVVFNEKDPSIHFKWNNITKMIVNQTIMYDADICQIYPICSTRMDAKGINYIIQIFSKLKEFGNKVLLIICNANGRKRGEELEDKIRFAESCGLNRDEFIFTSLLSENENNTENEVPHETVMQLMQMSNLFIMASKAEVCPNLLIEAAISNNLLVINSDLSLLYDFVNKENVLSYPFTSDYNLHYKFKDDKSLTILARHIEQKIKDNKADKQMRETWRKHRYEAIYYNMLAPILYENIKK